MKLSLWQQQLLRQLEHAATLAMIVGLSVEGSEREGDAEGCIDPASAIRKHVVSV